MATWSWKSLAVFLALTSRNLLEAVFTSTPQTVSGCIGFNATFPWVFDNQADAVSVIWDFGPTNVFNYQPSSGNTADGTAQFAGRVTHNGGGSITLDSLTASDAGSYTCTVTYNSEPTATDAATLNVNQPFTGSVSTVLTVSGSTATVNLGSQGGVDVEWKNEAGTVVSRGTTYTGEGQITVCLIGCVSASATSCQQIDLEPDLGPGVIAAIVIAVCVVVIAAVVIPLILWKKKLLCFKVPTEEKPTGSTNSGIRSTSPNQVKPSVENSDKKIDRLSVVNEKAQKPQTPGHLTADTVTSPKPRALPPIPEKEARKEKKKGSKKKRKRTKNEDGGEDSVKLPSIEKKEKNMEHYTKNKIEYESQ